VRMNDVRLLSVRGNQLAERVVDVIPQVLDRLENIKEKKKKQRIDVETPDSGK
ncbi:MAG TPA: sporulation protein YtfJ, partial [Gelria sp.]|nr:sporulation protein YtfJ [Gelria sp.]